MDISWLWLVVGLIPYSIKRQHMRDEQMLTVKALFWRLTMRWRKGQCSWDVYIPFIEHLRQLRVGTILPIESEFPLQHL